MIVPRLMDEAGGEERRLVAGDHDVAGPTNLIRLSTTGATAVSQQGDKEKALPLPGWLVKVYFIFPVILYIPDAIFNYYVYSDGAYIPNAPLPVQISQVALWGFLSIGVVGMAYLLSVLAPWHWSHGHRLQALFCWVGVLIATGVTIWNSLSYRSSTFKQFATDQWLYASFPQLAARGISVTMILVAIAPPFWGLFWALVQPTTHRKSLSALAESHQEKLMRVQHQAELKRLRAEANAQVREAQLKGMAQTAAAARAQAGTLFARNKDGEKGNAGEQATVSATAVTKAETKTEPAPVTTPASGSVGNPHAGRAGAAPMRRGDTRGKPLPGTPAYRKLVAQGMRDVRAQGGTLTAEAVALQLGERVEDVRPSFDRLMEE
jgi:hypothetical protein